MSARLRQEAGRWSTDARHVMAHDGACERRLVAAACVALRRAIFRSGGRWPAAAPTKLRRCRDG
ncbi:hypothetical protein F511_47097 [Dorcoceras hygrometricum]|uniref:Uncharacterized protein n=1 Tax=Dorcoceras hygrometricum TaxID=472368 RepID=A0A2Z6ZRU2_9LAMI|nr:hypothetical protein F511_47097 [Dorcoceras hygrometricum]